MIKGAVVNLGRNLSTFLNYLLDNVHVLFLGVFTPAFLMFLTLTPTSWGLDESVHVARAYQISEGVMYPQYLGKENSYGGNIPRPLLNALQEGRETALDARRDLRFYNNERRDGQALDQLSKYQSKPINSTDKTLFIFGTTGPYAPVVYAPSAFGILIGRTLDLSIIHTLTLARVLQGVMYAGAVYFALRMLKATRAKWIVLIVACLPASVFQVATINADAFTNAVMILFGALIVTFFCQKSKITRNQETLLLTSTVLVAMTKPSYALIMVLLALLPSRLFKDKAQMYGVKLGGVAVGVITFLAVSLRGLEYSSSNAINFTKEQVENMGLGAQLHFILSHPIDAFRAIHHTILELSNGWVHSMISTVGDNIVSPAYPLIVLVIVSLVVATLYFNSLTRLQAWILLGVSLLSGLAIIIILYGTVNQVGAYLILGVQGRYFIPCLLLFMIAAGSLLRVRVNMNASNKMILLVLPVTICLYGVVYSFAEALL